VAPPSTVVATALSWSVAVAILMRVITRFSRRQRRTDSASILNMTSTSLSQPASLVSISATS
jgi:hypothetical protein